MKSTDARIDAPAAIYARDAEVVIRHCTLKPIDRPEETPYGLLAAGRANVTFTEGRSDGFAYALMFTDGANGSVTRSTLLGAGHSVVTMHRNSTVKISENILGRCGYHAVRNTGGTMEMENNIVAENKRAGAYLGNKPAHGWIRNNLFLKSRGEIWAYSHSDVVIENNVFFSSDGPGVGFRDTCELVVRGNSFVGNKQGVAIYSRAEKAQSRVRLQGNHYWQNEELFLGFEGESKPNVDDPKFPGPVEGDFSPTKGSALVDKGGRLRAGLKDAKTIRLLWKLWKAKGQEKSGSSPSS